MKFLNHTYRTIITAVAFTLLISSEAKAIQNNKEKVESMRIAFITQRLDLTPGESKLFWPVYNNYRHDLAAIRHNFFPKDDGTDPHLDAEGQVDFEQRKLDLKKHYIPEFEQAIGKAKLNKLVNAEEDFKRMLMQIMRNRRQQRQGGWR